MNNTWIALIIIFLVLILILVIFWVLYNHKNIGLWTDFIDIMHREIVNESAEFKKKHLLPNLPSNSKFNGKILVISLSVGKRDFANYSKNSLQEYCDIHDYDFRYIDEYEDKEYAPYWWKIFVLKKALHEVNIHGCKYDAVVWFDDDIYITNMDFKLETALNATNRDIILTHDPGSPAPSLLINTGVMIFRNTKLSKEFLDSTIECSELFGGRYKKVAFHEQSVITYLYYKKYYNDIWISPCGMLQSFLVSCNYSDLTWNPKSFCLHLCGENSENRKKIFSDLSNGILPVKK